MKDEHLAIFAFIVVALISLGIFLSLQSTYNRFVRWFEKKVSGG